MGAIMPPPRGLLQRVDQYLHRAEARGEAVPRSAKIVIACSGGADSVALLRLMHALNQSSYWRWTLAIGHVDHGIRKESSDDADFVRHIAGTLGLMFMVERLNLGRAASEDQARRARLAALRKMVRRGGHDGAVMGHHADDQAETVILRIVRGCGLEGLGGMAERSVIGAGSAALCLYRPLLTFRRDDLRTFLAEIGQKWREDHTNDSAEYLRNRVRHEVLPLLETMNPGARDGLVRLAALAREARAWIVREASAVALDAVVRIHPRKVAVHRAKLRNLSDGGTLLAAEVLRYAVDLVGGRGDALDFERLREAVRVVLAAEGGKRVELGNGVALVPLIGKVSVWPSTSIRAYPWLRLSWKRSISPISSRMESAWLIFCGCSCSSRQPGS